MHGNMYYHILLFFIFSRIINIRGGILACVCAYGVFYYGPFCKDETFKMNSRTYRWILLGSKEEKRKVSQPHREKY